MHPTGYFLIHFHPSITINLMRLNCGVGDVQRRLLSSRNAALQALYLCTNQWVWIKPLVAHQYRAHVAQFSYDETLSDGMSPHAIGICLVLSNPQYTILGKCRAEVTQVVTIFTQVANLNLCFQQTR